MKTELLSPSRLSHELREEDSDDLSRRRAAIVLSFAGAAIGAIVGAYQTGILKRLPDILPGKVFDAEKVDASDYAYENLQQPDGPMMLMNYGVTAMAFAAGGKDRAEQNPVLPALSTAKAGFDLALCSALAVKEWRTNRALCSWCQVATALSAVTFALSVPETLRAIDRRRALPAA